MKKRVYKTLVNMGKILLTIDLLLLLAIVFNSLTIKGKVNYGDRCYVQDNFDFINEYQYDGITLENNELKCNTYYLIYNSSLDTNGNILFLNSMAKLLEENDNNVNIHVMILSKEKQILASIVNYKITYIESELK